MTGNVGQELTFLLPKAESKTFPDLFSNIETVSPDITGFQSHNAFLKRKTELGIENYGVSVTTMEEVFLKVPTAVKTNH